MFLLFLFFISIQVNSNSALFTFSRVKHINKGHNLQPLTYKKIRMPRIEPFGTQQILLDQIMNLQHLP